MVHEGGGYQVGVGRQSNIGRSGNEMDGPTGHDIDPTIVGGLGMDPDQLDRSLTRRRIIGSGRA